MKNQSLDCIQCNELFSFTADEQQKYMDMDFDPPKRCPDCRKNRTKLSMSENHHREAGQKRRSKPSRIRRKGSSMG